jgi:hypothetical protein
MYLEKLIRFLKTAESDPRIGTAHIAVYTSLFELWCEQDGKDPVSFTKEAVMKAAKIQSRATYYGCMRVLNQCGYIKYFPSHCSVLENLVFMEEK